jgi:hypothetical protein
MMPILQSHLPPPLWDDATAQRLPGIKPLRLDDWIWVDDAYSEQMALREKLIRERCHDVLAVDADAQAAACELLNYLLAGLEAIPDFELTPQTVTRPDGVRVCIDWDNPLKTAGLLVQEDLCLMQNIGGEHVLTGAVLCFPAGWTLHEKMMRPLAAIHSPVKTYDADVGRRVDRLFDAIRPEQPLWRANGFFYDDALLFAPLSEGQQRPNVSTETAYFRAERQCLLKLEQSKAVVFSIHTFVVKREDLTPTQARNIQKHFGQLVSQDL